MWTADLQLSKQEATVYGYRHDVDRFNAWLDERNVKHLKRMKATHIVEHLAALKEAGKSEATLFRAFCSIKSFTRFCKRMKYIDVNLTEDITPPPNKQKAPVIVTVEEMRRILAAPDVETYRGVRDRAMLELIYSSGLRASELCGLQLRDVVGSQVVVRKGKRGKVRTVPITEDARHWIKHYVEEWRGDGDGELFRSYGGKKVSRQYLSALVGGYAREVGLEGVSAHTLRHACATHLLDNGANLIMIQKVLGHESVATTQRYTHLSSESIKATFDECHPSQQPAGELEDGESIDVGNKEEDRGGIENLSAS